MSVKRPLEPGATSGAMGPLLRRYGKPPSRLSRFGSIGIAATLMLVLSLFGMPAAYAAEFGMEIPIDTVVRGAEDTVHDLASRAVGPEFAGQECTVTSRAVNQISVHPNSDLIVKSGSSQVVVPDVESAPNATVVAEEVLTLGDEIAISVRLGEDGIFSGGITVTVECLTPQRGQIVVVKQVTDGSSTSQEFEFSTSYGEGFSLSDGGENASGDLAPGTYSVTESVAAGWTLESAVCDDGSDPEQVDLTAGETVTCTFTNDEVEVSPEILPEIAITKSPDVDVANPGDVVDFIFVISNPSATEPVRITSIADSAFGELPGDADCEVDVILAAGGSCEFTFAWTVTADDIGTHENEVEVIGVDVENPEVTVRATAEAVVEVSEVGGIVISPEQPADVGVEAEQLPFTGVGSERLLGLAVLLMGAGVLLLRWAPRGDEDSP